MHPRVVLHADMDAFYASIEQRDHPELRGKPVAVGGAPVKMVAKIASDLAKPDGLLEVAPGDVADFLAPLPVRRIWGVGPVAEQRLLAAGYATIGDLVRADPRALAARFGPWGG